MFKIKIKFLKETWRLKVHQEETHLYIRVMINYNEFFILLKLYKFGIKKFIGNKDILIKYFSLN